MTDVLIVEDNKEMSLLLSDFLKAEGYSCITAESGEEALDYLSENTAGMVLLDIMLPGIDGFAVCREIREEKNTPVLIISAKSDKEDKLRGLVLGADDYIEKPYDIDILIAKINGIFKRQRGRDNISVISDGNLKIDTERRMVFCNDELITLTSKEYQLLLLLAENKGKALKKEWIFNKIWGVDSFSEMSTLTVHIKWLRQKIEDNPKEPSRILTVWGVGYRFE